MFRSFFCLAVLFLSDFAYLSSATATPTIVSAAVPFYPPLARAAKVEGEVIAEVVTSGEVFADIRILTGHPLLIPAVTTNLRTWVLVSAPTATFKIGYHYTISERCKGNPSVTLNLPTNVSICSPPDAPLD